MKPNQIRIERKWSTNLNNDQIKLALMNSKFYFKEHYPKRKINSIYFDDDKHTRIFENLSGINKRIKIRVRWYGDYNNIIKPKLEVKIKENFNTKKIVKKLNIKDKLYFKDINSIRLLQKKCLDYYNFNYSNVNFFPSHSTHYKRDYLISNDKTIRATIDYELFSYNLFNQSINKIRRSYFYNRVLEFKYDYKNEQKVKDLLDVWNLRLSKNSKFVISALNEPFSLSI